MERALNLESIATALGGSHALLPQPGELRDLLAQTELQVFLGRQEMSDDLLAAGWYLHSVGSASVSLQLYGADQQRRANQVAAHIFDLALQSGERDRLETLQLTFAAQVGYLRGELDPNAAALYRRLERTDFSFLGEAARPILEMAVMLLALDRERFFAEARRLREELTQLTSSYAMNTTVLTLYAAPDLVLRAMVELMIFLTQGDVGTAGDEGRLERVRRDLTTATSTPPPSDFDTRWVAAHLLDLADGFGQSSVWSVLPPGIPPTAGRAMALGNPPVLSLWPPQLDLLKSADHANPLITSTKRLVLSFPTSAGKTLLAQLFVAAHLVQASGRVCYVAPTHSLCREVQRAFDSRLGYMSERVRDEGALGTSPSYGAANARVSVMTPERLAQLLRTDPKRILDEYSLFVIDEAHLIGERDRGWALEATLSFLHSETQETDHRIIVISAAIGNRVEIQQWLNPDEAVEPLHRDWRGPRRGHAVFTTRADWSNEVIEPPRRANGLTRKRVPLWGDITIRSGPGSLHALHTTEPVGDLVLAQRPEGWKRYASDCTAFYKMQVPVVTHLGQHGPVLIVEPTKDLARRFAEALADALPETDETVALVRLAALRLTDLHPLVKVLRHGVAYHHAALPDDLQVEIEDALRGGKIRYLVATTTLTEGVNLPVRSVFIGGLGYYTADGFVETLDAPRLINAMGRAGRACVETEGWVVLAVSANFSEALFNQLQIADEELTVRSRLAVDEALEALAEFEALSASTADAVFQVAAKEASDFLSYVWFVADSLVQLRGSWTAEDVIATLEATLAWKQLAGDLRDRWLKVAEEGLVAFEATSPGQRRRWSRTGLPLPGSRSLEELAAAVHQLLLSREDLDPAAVEDALFAVFGEGRLELFLQIGSSNFRGFRRATNSPRDQVLAVDLYRLLRDWVAGVDLYGIGEAHLGDVANEDFRYAQLSEFVTSVLEHHLPWLGGHLLTWVNSARAAQDPFLVELRPDLSGLIHFGVGSAPALELLTAGVRSRRLALVVAEVYASEAPGLELREWLAGLGVDRWRANFDPAPSEIADLLIFSRVPDANLAAAALDGETVTADVFLDGDIGADPNPVTLRRDGAEDPPSIAIYGSAAQRLGRISAHHHEEIDRILRVGLPLSCELGDNGGLPVLRLAFQQLVDQ